MRNLFLLLSIVSICAFSCTTNKTDVTDENKAFMHRFVEGLNQKNWDEMVKFAFSESDFEQYKTVHSKFRASFPDYHFNIEAIFAQGDSVVTIGTVTATYVADYKIPGIPLVPATGQHLKWKEIWVGQVIDGKFGSSGWMMNDIFTQFGLDKLQETPPN